LQRPSDGEASLAKRLVCIVIIIHLISTIPQVSWAVLEHNEELRAADQILIAENYRPDTR
jgi:hypothetical protein